ncbi:hypothetical protein C0J52_03309, partial [Blattella germanica]
TNWLQKRKRSWVGNCHLQKRGTHPTDEIELNNNCSNNQAGQLAIIKALESITRHNTRDEPVDNRKVAIYTDSQITLDSLRNANNHNCLIEKIREQLKAAEDDNWLVEFGWVKEHVEIFGNELADRLAKQAASDDDLNICYNRIPISAVKKQLAAISEEKWEMEWVTTTEGATTKSYFPRISDRLNRKIQLSPTLTTLMTGHGNINAYFHRFKIKECAVYVCGNGSQTVGHMIYDCVKLQIERKTLIDVVNRTGGKWPIDKSTLSQKYGKRLIRFTNSIKIEKLQ